MTRHGVAARGVAGALTSAAICLAVPPAVAEAAPAGCPALYVLGVAGTGESSSDRSTTIDSGMLGAVMSPLLTMAGSTVQRAYVPYPSGFGGADGKDPATFQASVSKAVARTKSMVGQIAGRCSETRFAFAGYSQGAYAVSMFLQEVVGGQAPISVDRVAAGALLGDPTRPQGAGPFPGSSATRPDATPGTNGQAVGTLPPVSSTTNGGGIGPAKDAAPNYGPLTGRVLSYCQAGDLACDAPSGSPIVHVVTNIAGQSTLDQRDPVKTLTSIANALALTTVKAAVPVINEDVQGETVQDLSYQPGQSLSKRLATASDPRTPLPSVDEAMRALIKVGTIGFNAAITVAQKVFTADTIAKLAVSGMANPAAALTVLGQKALEATVELVPPSTIDRWTQEAFSAVTTEITDNADLLDVSNLARYWQTAQQHTSYGQPAPAVGGMSPARWIAAWFAAIAADLTGKSFSASGTPSADPGVPASGVTPTVPESLSDSTSSSTAASSATASAVTASPTPMPSTASEATPSPTPAGTTPSTPVPVP